MAISSAIAALLKPEAKRGRNQFPLDNKQVYSMKAGQITPVNTFHFMPGDFLKMKVADFALTFPMQTAPFLRGRKEFSFYTVYYNAIWSLFNQSQASRPDPKTSVFGPAPSMNEPRISLAQLYMACFQQWVYYIYDKYTFGDSATLLTMRENWRSTAKGSFCMIDTARTFDINNQLSSLGSSISSANLACTVSNSFDFAAPYNTNRDYIFDIVGQYRVYNWVRKLDMLGYGNIYPILNKYERKVEDAGLSYTRTNGVIDSQDASILQDIFVACFRELELCCININTNTPKMVNLYAICAYNSVFYHFFRNSYYDLQYHPRNYNLDYFTANNNAFVIWIDKLPMRFLDIEYHQWKKDMFTSVLPDTQFGAVSSVTLTPISGTVTINGNTGSDYDRWTDLQGNPIKAFDNILSDAEYSSLRTENINSAGTPRIKHTHTVSGTGTISGSNSFDVIALKRAEMLQDYRQTIMRAGNKTSDIFRAIYGGAPSSEHEDDVIPRFLDTFGIDIFVDPVTATANTGNNMPNGELGDIAARGKFRGDSGTIKFNAGNNFGVLLTLAYVVPTAEYNSYMLDKHNLELTPEDHFIPQFENLGLEPIYSDELNCLSDARTLSVLGYAPRYHHKKCAVDKVHGAFCSKYPRYAELTGNPNIWYGDFNHWVSPRTELQQRVVSQIKDFYINPSVLDNVFVQAAGADLSQDQFICNTFFEMAATRQMSKVGLINFV